MWMGGWGRVEGRAGHSGICGAPHPHASPVPPSPPSRGEGRVRGIALRWRDAVPRQRPSRHPGRSRAAIPRVGYRTLHEPRPACDNPLLSDPQKRGPEALLSPVGLARLTSPISLRSRTTAMAGNHRQRFDEPVTWFAMDGDKIVSNWDPARSAVASFASGDVSLRGPGNDAPGVS